jgi:hypothetical protein
MQSDDPVVVGISGAAEEPGRFGPVDEPNCAVVTQEQVVRHLTNGRAAGVTVTANGQEELVLSRGKAGGMSLLLAPALKVPQPGPQSEQLGISRIRQGHSAHDIISSRWICGHEPIEDG